jgi:hypothetical protein
MKDIVKMMLLNPALGDLSVYQHVTNQRTYKDWNTGSKFIDNIKYQTKSVTLTDSSNLYVGDTIDLINHSRGKILAFGTSDVIDGMVMQVRRYDHVGEVQWYSLSYFKSLVNG